MKGSPIAWGVGGGLALLLALAPSVGTALGRLGAAREDRATLSAALAAPPAARGPLVAKGLALSDPQALVAQIRERARSGGVLVEEAVPMQGSGALITIRLRISGPEKAVIALADALEREAPLVRLRSWRLAAIEGGVRLSGDAVAVKP